MILDETDVGFNLAGLPGGFTGIGFKARLCNLYDAFPLGPTDGGHGVRWQSEGIQHAAGCSSLGKAKSQPRLF